MAGKDSIEILADRVEKIACANCGHHLNVSALPIFTFFHCPECHAQQMVPGKLGNFLLLEELGRGGMGVVYRGLDMALGRPVAIKVMHKSLGDDPQFLENFLREARAAAAINHKNVVQIFSFGREKGQPYLVMELVDGGRLDAYISSSQPLTEAQALTICTEVAEGLKAAHDVGLMHGDIKPANILFDKKGVAKVADFGLAGFIRQQKAGSHDIWGTPFYIAPEKARRQKVDQRADIYSLGATMFHALTIRPPFDGDNPTEVVLARLQLPPPDITAARPDLHPETVRIITRMLAPDTLVRYPNYASLLSDLQEAKAKLPDQPAAAAATHHKAPQPAGAKRWIYFAVGGGTLLVLAAIIGVVVLTRNKNEPSPTTAPPAATTETVAATGVNPFNADEDKLLVEAIKPIGRGAVVTVAGKLEALYRDVCPGDVQRQWIRVFQALALYADKRDADADALLNKLPAPPLLVTNAAGEALRLPLTAAQYLLKTLNAADAETTNNLTPPWYGALVQYLEGSRVWLAKGPQPNAVAALKNYVAAGVNAPGWPFAFKPLAAHWLQQADEYNQVAQRVAALLRNKQFKEARQLWTDFLGKCGPAVQTAVKANLGQVDEQERQDADARKKVEEAKKKAVPTMAPQPPPAASPKPSPKPPPKPEHVIPPPELKAVFASSETKADPARLAIDGDLSTHWASLARDNQWIIVDLGETRKVSGVVLNWGSGYAIDYKIQVSTDRASWTEAMKVTDNKGNRDVRIFKPVAGRYVRIYCLIREPMHPGIELAEIKVLVDGNKPPPPP